MTRPADHKPMPPRRIGVLLVNLGTPDAPTAQAVRRYLAEFLSDARVVDYPRAVWLPLLYGFILRVRPPRTAEKYAKVWMKEGSPLRVYAQRAAEAVAARFDDSVRVDWAMRFGARSIDERLNALKADGCDRIVVLPMYPQYSQTTSASVADTAFASLAPMKWQPALRIGAPFYDSPAYIGALKRSLGEAIAMQDFAPERVILSFHGAPLRHLEHDPYYCHCAKTARLLREAMGWDETFAPLAFQSRFGREPWLGPATDDTLRGLAAAGVRRVMVATPGFLADCIETLEEIAIECADLFREAGGERYAALPCLNASPAAIDMLEHVIRAETAGWMS